MQTARPFSSIHTTSLCVITILAFLAGCGEKGKPEKFAERTPIDTADHSLTVDRYVREGVPAPERNWTALDMQTAYRTLARLARQNPDSLPVLDSKLSGPLFARLVNEEELKPFRDKTRPIQQRLDSFLEYVTGYKELWKIYAQEVVAERHKDLEAAALTVKLLNMTVLMMDMSSELIASLNPKEEDYTVRKSAFDNLRRNIAVLAQGTLVTISEKDRHRLAARKKLLRNLQDTLPPLSRYMVAEDRTGILGTIDGLLDRPELQNLEEDLKTLRQRVAEAISAKEP